MTPEQVRSQINGEGFNVVRIPIEERRQVHLGRPRGIPTRIWVVFALLAIAFVAGFTFGTSRGEAHCAQQRVMSQ